MNSKTVVVLGANSFSGQDFIDLLLDDPNFKVAGVSRAPERPSVFLKHKNKSNTTRYNFYQFDMNTQCDDLLNLFDTVRPNWIVNFAALSEVAPSWEHPEHWFETNVVALAKIVNHLRRQNYVERYLHISSPEAYGSCSGSIDENTPDNPSTPYAASKAAADMLLSCYFKQYGFPSLTVRATNVYGARQQLFKIIPRTAINLKLGRRIQLHGGGRAIKSYIHIRDVSRGELLVLQRGTLGERYHLSPDRGISIRDLVSRICSLAGRSFADSIEVVDERPGQDAVYEIDSSKARNGFDWFPRIGLDEGLDEVLRWVDDNWPELKDQELEYIHRI